MEFKRNPKTTFKKIEIINKSEAPDEIRDLQDRIGHHDCLYHIRNLPGKFEKLIQR